MPRTNLQLGTRSLFQIYNALARGAFSIGTFEALDLASRVEAIESLDMPTVCVFDPNTAVILSRSALIRTDLATPT